MTSPSLEQQIDNKFSLSLLLAFLFTIPYIAVGQTARPETPEEKLAQSAGVYLGAIEYVRVLKQSSCGYAFRRTFPPIDEVLRKEILPAFSPTAQKEVEASFGSMKPALARQAQKFVGEIIAAEKKELDPKTACGVAAGMLGGIGSQAFGQWKSAKSQYGWKGR